MSTVVRYSGHPLGYMDFYFGEELILCQNTIPEVTAQQLWDGITGVEDDQLAMGFLGIAFAEGKTQFVDTALSVVLARSWRIGSEKTSGSFLLKDGNIVSETLGVFPFEVNNSVFMANQTIQFGVQIATGSGLTPDESTKLLSLPQKEDNAQHLLKEVQIIVGN